MSRLDVLEAVALLADYGCYQEGIINYDELPENIGQLAEAIECVCDYTLRSWYACGFLFDTPELHKFIKELQKMDSKNLSPDILDAATQIARDHTLALMEGRQFLATVLKGKLHLDLLDQGLWAASPDQALIDSMRAVRDQEENGRAKLISALAQLLPEFEAEFAEAQAIAAQAKELAHG